MRTQGSELLKKLFKPLHLDKCKVLTTADENAPDSESQTMAAVTEATDPCVTIRK